MTLFLCLVHLLNSHSLLTVVFLVLSLVLLIEFVMHTRSPNVNQDMDMYIIYVYMMYKWYTICKEYVYDTIHAFILWLSAWCSCPEGNCVSAKTNFWLYELCLSISIWRKRTVFQKQLFVLVHLLRGSVCMFLMGLLFSVSEILSHDLSLCSEQSWLDRGLSIKYIMQFLAKFWPLPLSHFVTHPGTPQKYVTYLGPPDFY